MSLPEKRGKSMFRRSTSDDVHVTQAPRVERCHGLNNRLGWTRNSRTLTNESKIPHRFCIFCSESCYHQLELVEWWLIIVVCNLELFREFDEWSTVLLQNWLLLCSCRILSTRASLSAIAIAGSCKQKLPYYVGPPPVDSNGGSDTRWYTHSQWRMECRWGREMGK